MATIADGVTYNGRCLCCTLDMPRLPEWELRDLTNLYYGRLRIVHIPYNNKCLRCGEEPIRTCLKAAYGTYVW